ncbi:MAG: transporter substrate-binding domain-containing protein [Acidiferrobacterales bacterium]|nr:transporter substrate-binding domain-containing protein [Acidiferrobacterales bacterium]
MKSLLASSLIFVALSLVPLQATSAQEGSVRVGVDPGYPPFSGVGESGDLKGFDIDIAQTLCDTMNVVCKFVKVEWKGLIPQLRAGTIDAIVSSMSITEERREKVAFTERYYSNVVRFVAHKNSTFNPNEPAGRTIGVAPATVSSMWLEKNVASIATIRYFTEQGSIYEALKSGEIDAIFGDGLGYWHWLQGPDGADFDFTGDGYRIDEGIGIAVRKDDRELLDKLNQAIRTILDDGTYEKINDRYFPFSIY